ncbi:YtxH domain-containing protein [Anaerolineales bacterium HSG6]|nr:YtxH domain-containing protein [Anaerolineales bacterium HSG6]
MKIYPTNGPDKGVLYMAGSTRSFFTGFLMGGVIGIVVALMMAPQSGEETRSILKDKGLEYKDLAEEGALIARQRGTEAMEKGRANATDTLQRSKSNITDTINQRGVGRQNGH